MMWPEIITNPDYEYSGVKIREHAIADGCSAWACCHLAPEELPKNFGKGMAKISLIVGSASPEYLEKEADKIIECK